MTAGHGNAPNSGLRAPGSELLLRLFAVVPAAGQSRRMGRPKLLLPWGAHTVIEHVLTVLSTTCTAIAVVIRPDDTPLADTIAEWEEWHRRLAGAGEIGSAPTIPSPVTEGGQGRRPSSPSPLVREGWGGGAPAEEPPEVSATTSPSNWTFHLIVPSSAPPDMRASVQHGLDDLASHCHPSERDGWLLVPADQPTLRPEWIVALSDARPGAPDGILVPTHAGRRGHPVLFPWPLAAEVPRLAADTGVNQLLRTFAERVREIPVPDAAVLTDLDTPADYRRLTR